MRAPASFLVLVACARGTTDPMTMEPLPPWADDEGGVLVARCGAIEVSATPIGSAIALRYAEAGAASRRSWAVVEAIAIDDSATIGGQGGLAVLATAELVLAIDEACRVTVRQGERVILEDEIPFAVGSEARLVRHAPGDRVYGLGERTGGLDKRGRAWTFWNTDAYDPAHGGWAPEQDPLYQSIPLEVRLAGGISHGVFTDETRRMVLDLGAADPTRDTLAATGARSITQYVIAGPKPADVVARYVALTGQPALPPRWALGFHQSRWGYTNADELVAIADRFRAERIPAEALWLDIQHLRGFRSFTFDDAKFPPDTMQRLAARGFRTIAIADPGIKVDPAWDVYQSALAGGHFLTKPDGTVYEGTAWPGASAFPDLSRPAARAWWGAQVKTLAERGIAGIWLDVNEPTTFPEGGGGNTIADEVLADGDGEPTTMATLHNAYALLQAGATYDALAARGEQPFVLSRAGYAGIQRYAAVWTGDVPSTWSGLAQTLPMLLGLGISGVPIVGSDIGGYSGHATPELYARWLALGSVSPFARAHVTSGVPGQEPWMFGSEVTDIARARLGDRMRFLPYLYSLADEASRTGAPILRPLVWEFPGDPAVENLGDQAMLGPSILVAPIVTAGATSREVYLPAGRWYELHSGAIFDGPTTITTRVTLAALPMYVREGAIIPTSGDSGELVLEVYPAPSPSSFTLVEDSGRTTIALAGLADGATLALDRAGPATVRVHRVDGHVDGVDGATFIHDTDAGTLTAQAATGGTLRFRYDPTIAEPRRSIAVVFEVRVPADTPVSPPIHVATSGNGWQHVALAWVSPGLARGTVAVPRGEWLDYKYTRGSWETVEKWPGCVEAANRYRFGGGGGTGGAGDVVATWRDRCP